MSGRKDVELSLPVAPQHADWGHGDKAFRHVLVRPDGEVLGFDHVAGHYSRHHGLPDADAARARGLAAQVRSGTHYTAAGYVLPVCHAAVRGRR